MNPKITYFSTKRTILIDDRKNVISSKNEPILTRIPTKNHENGHEHIYVMFFEPENLLWNSMRNSFLLKILPKITIRILLIRFQLQFITIFWKTSNSILSESTRKITTAVRLLSSSIFVINFDPEKNYLRSK